MGSFLLFKREAGQVRILLFLAKSQWMSYNVILTCYKKNQIRRKLDILSTKVSNNRWVNFIKRDSSLIVHCVILTCSVLTFHYLLQIPDMKRDFKLYHSKKLRISFLNFSNHSCTQETSYMTTDPRRRIHSYLKRVLTQISKLPTYWFGWVFDFCLQW